MWNVRLDDSQAGIKIARRKINNLDDTTLMAESEEELKSLLMVKEKSGKLWFKTQHSKNEASSPITSWQIDGDKMETVIDFIFLGSKITMDGDYSHKIKRCLLLGRKATTNQLSILKNRHITLPTSVHTIKAMFFSSSYVQMWELNHKEGWAMKNWCFWTVVVEKTRESLDSKEIKSFILKDISHEYSLEGLMLKLELQYFGHLLGRVDCIWTL